MHNTNEVQTLHGSLPIADERVGVQVIVWNQIPWEHVPYLSASAVVIHYEEALYQVYAPLPLHIFVFYRPTLEKQYCRQGLEKCTDKPIC